MTDGFKLHQTEDGYFVLEYEEGRSQFIVMLNKKELGALVYMLNSSLMEMCREEAESEKEDPENGAS